MINNIPKFFDLVEKKFTLNEKIAQKLPGYRATEDWNNYKVYIKSMNEELKETIDEIKNNNSVKLEDELGDIFWTYLNLLHTLEKDGYINTKKVFDRSYKKYNERITGIQSGLNWDEVKNKQKNELKQEHNNKYN